MRPCRLRSPRSSPRSCRMSGQDRRVAGGMQPVAAVVEVDSRVEETAGVATNPVFCSTSVTSPAAAAAAGTPRRNRQDHRQGPPRGIQARRRREGAPALPANEAPARVPRTQDCASIGVKRWRMAMPAAAEGRLSRLACSTKSYYRNLLRRCFRAGRRGSEGLPGRRRRRAGFQLQRSMIQSAASFFLRTHRRRVAGNGADGCP